MSLAFGVILRLGGAYVTNLGVTLQKLSHARQQRVSRLDGGDSDADEEDDGAIEMKHGANGPNENDQTKEDTEEVNTSGIGKNRDISDDTSDESRQSFLAKLNCCGSVPWLLWLLGVFLFAIGNVANFGALVWTPASLYAALGTAGLAWNCLNSRVFLQEYLTPRVCFATLLIVGGAALSTFTSGDGGEAGSSSSTWVSLDSVSRAPSTPVSVWLMLNVALYFAHIVGIMLHARRWKQFREEFGILVDEDETPEVETPVSISSEVSDKKALEPAPLDTHVVHLRLDDQLDVTDFDAVDHIDRTVDRAVEDVCNGASNDCDDACNQSVETVPTPAETVVENDRNLCNTSSVGDETASEPSDDDCKDAVYADGDDTDHVRQATITHRCETVVGPIEEYERELCLRRRAMRSSRWLSVLLPSLAALLASTMVACIKLISEITQSSLSKKSGVSNSDSGQGFGYLASHALPWLLVVATIAFAVLHLRVLNAALRKFDQLLVVPVFAVCLSSFALLSGALLFADFSQQKMMTTLLFALSQVISFAGVVLLAYSARSASEDDVCAADGLDTVLAGDATSEGLTVDTNRRGLGPFADVHADIELTEPNSAPTVAALGAGQTGAAFRRRSVCVASLDRPAERRIRRVATLRPHNEPQTPRVRFGLVQSALRFAGAPVDGGGVHHQHQQHHHDRQRRHRREHSAPDFDLENPIPRQARRRIRRARKVYRTMPNMHRGELEMHTVDSEVNNTNSSSNDSNTNDNNNMYTERTRELDRRRRSEMRRVHSAATLPFEA